MLPFNCNAACVAERRPAAWKFPPGSEENSASHVGKFSAKICRYIDIYTYIKF